METSQSINKGVWSIIIERFKPQKNWESFSPASAIPKDMKGAIPLPAEKTRSKYAKPEVEGFT
jgi:hypothetical protein